MSHMGTPLYHTCLTLSAFLLEKINLVVLFVIIIKKNGKDEKNPIPGYVPVVGDSYVKPHCPFLPSTLVSVS